MARTGTYPFEPRSNAYLEPGQFWGIPLSDGRYACGRVLAIPSRSDPHLFYTTKTFMAGLMDWVGQNAPSAETIAGASLLAQGLAHVLTIRENGRLILGHRELALDAITGLREVSHRGGGTVWLYEGAKRLRPATRDEARELPVLSTWGFKVVEVLAERRFVQGLAIVR